MFDFKTDVLCLSVLILCMKFMFNLIIPNSYYWNILANIVKYVSRIWRLSSHIKKVFFFLSFFFSPFPFFDFKVHMMIKIVYKSKHLIDF